MSKQTDFIETIAPLARAEFLNRSRWVLPSVCIAQAALESGWNVNAKTLFGIKGNGSALKTVEYINGKYAEVTAKFQAYPNIASAVHGYYDLITGNSRYCGAVNCLNYKYAVHAIKNGGYATDPNYAQKVINIIEAYNLTRYDNRTVEAHTLTVDGVMGYATTRRTQEYFKTTPDGVISGQTKTCINRCPGITTMKQGKNGSQMVRAMQAWLGCSQDGKLGPETVSRWQAKMGTVVDGTVSKPSMLIRAWQEFLNKQ